MNLGEAQPLPLHTPRVMGLETEFMVVPDNVVMSTEKLCDNAEARLGTHVVGEFLGNGGRLYLDTGSHPEYAGPECLSGHSIALASRAGDLIVSAALEPIIAMAETHNEPGSKLYKRTLDAAGNSVGSHENYYIRSPGQEAVAHFLLPHLVSRTIFTGSGFVNARGVYSLDQRVRVMTNTTFGKGSLRDRPFVLHRDEHLSDDGHRLQVLSGSANMLDAPTKFKFDSTSLVIRMIEHRLLPKEFVIEQPGYNARKIALQQFGDNYFFDRTVKIAGKRMTAAQIQLFYASTAKVMADFGMLNDYDSDFACLWYDMATDAVDGKIDKWDHSIDWLAKLARIERFRTVHGGITRRKAQEIDISYHQLPVGKEKTIIEVIKKHGLVGQLFTEQEIHGAVYQSPDVTRARERGQFIKDHTGNRIKNRFSPRVDWINWSYDSRRYGSPTLYRTELKHHSPYARKRPTD